ncbi:MAG: tyrosine recombinase [Cyanobacteria bacterium SIG28]|nr:tyrosine recombinase [Cyanobacteria bacterium SIG28]
MTTNYCIISNNKSKFLTKFKGCILDKRERDFIDGFKNYLSIEKNFSEHTLDAYCSDIVAYILWLDGISCVDVDFNKLREYLHFIQRFDYKKTTIARKTASIRTFYKYLFRERYTDSNPALSLSAPKRPKSLPKFLTTEEVEKILNNVKIDTPAGFRNKVILELLWATGMRVSELSNLNFGDLNLEENEIRVFGKGAKERIVLVSQRAKQYLEQYITTARKLIAPEYNTNEINDNTPLFINSTGFRLQNKTIRKAINDVVEKIELPKKVTPHVFRHSFATRLIENGADLRVVQELLGHAGISNTQIYTHISMKHMQEVYESAHPHS